ncbi:MAG: stage IV sporulation protein A [Lachnospiraceae bacterium]|nr:stage IV sporulation protein A [Lachnospiraceae bacterium]
MEKYNTNTYDLYHDIQERCKGEIYIGVLGPVRTGKSTFIKRFMDVCVLPFMEDEHAKQRAMDELPQSAGGKTITTTEPKFIPKEAAQIPLTDGIDVKVRLIDCVGYMVEGAAGHMEEDTERMVRTPWFEEEIPFTQAAEIGTDKVMNDHSTIGLVVLTDGSFGEISRANYVPAEEKTIAALKKIHKPFLVLLNSQKPYSEETQKLAEELKQKYGVAVLPVNCAQLKKEDIYHILENVLYEFPISVMEFYMPKWIEMLPDTNKLKQELMGELRQKMTMYSTLRDCMENPMSMESEFVDKVKMDHMNLANGVVRVQLSMDDAYYYEMLSGMLGEQVKDEYQLLAKLKEYAAMKNEYAKVLEAVQDVRLRGYGVVKPTREEILLNEPEVIRHGNKYGVKIKAVSPSVHMIKANIETEIAPIVGTQQQAEDLIKYIGENAKAENGIWDTNIFGKTVEQLVNDGIAVKTASIGEECQVKLQDTMQKVVNDSNGGMVCIII